jgi:heme/copper-type cytochrome/quinol oxidase subunit 2
VNDVIQTFVRPIAGAILFAASAGVIGESHPILAMICGLLVAGAVHAAKATARPVITATTGGTLNPVVSTAEDILSLVVAVLAILAPILGLILLVLVIIWFIRRRRRRRAEAAAEWG